MPKLRLIAIIAYLAVGGPFLLQAQEPEKPRPPKTRILFVFDASQSMYAQWESGTKIDIAERLMNAMLDSLAEVPDPNFELALRVYGHQKPVPPQDCSDTRLEVPFSGNNIRRIKQKLSEIRPKGTTPIARSLERAAYDFPSNCSNCRNVIILITDGVEACDGDPCSVSRALQKQGIILKPFVIGIGLDDQFKESFECVGQYYDASNEQTFKNILGLVISQALNNTTAQVNLLDERGLPTETDVNMSFYDITSSQLKYNYIHTINHRGNPDTIILDPLVEYRMVVHTIPSVSKDSIKIIPGTHNLIAVDAPQGWLQLRVGGIGGNRNFQCIVRRAGSMRTLNVQQFNESEKYLTGKYDLEILTVPRYMEYGVQINQSTTTKIEIPAPGLVTLNAPSYGSGSIYVEDGNELVWVLNMPNNKRQNTYYLQPGRYRVVYRPQNAKESIYTIEKKFRIESGGSSVVNLK